MTDPEIKLQSQNVNNMSWLASLPGVEALSTFASHWLVDHDDLTVVTMGMDDTWGNQQQSKKPEEQREKRVNRKEKLLLISIHTTHTHTHSHTEMPQILQPKPFCLNTGLKSLYTTWQSTDGYCTKLCSTPKRTIIIHEKFSESAGKPK